MSKPFQFALMAMPEDGKQWLGLARRAEDLEFAPVLELLIGR